MSLLFQVHQSFRRSCDIGQQIQYEICYLLRFDLWTFKFGVESLL
jgi:hypothetical protein